MIKTKLLLILMFLGLNYSILSNDDYTIEELDMFLRDGIITEEEHMILKNEITGFSLLDDKFLYDVKINNTIRTKGFKINRKEGKFYYPLIDFLFIVGAENYEINKSGIKMILGENLLDIQVNYLDRTYMIKDKKYEYKEGDIYEEKGEIYLEEEIFKNIFTRRFEKKEKEFGLDIGLKFKTKQEIDILLENRSLRLGEENSKDTLFFTTKNSIFDLGYLNFDLSLDYDSSGEDSLDRSGSIEYQGGFLFGELSTSYDIETKEMGDVEIYYPNLINNHSLEVGSYGSGSDNRELGFSLKKEKGFYDEEGEIIIREKVPTGSRVELLYLGFPIDIQDAENGEVEFKNSELKNDRNYELRVYSPDGKISLIEIDTSTNYNQQKKGSFEYNIYSREDNEIDEFLGNGEVYYGFSDIMTIGLGYEKDRWEEEVFERLNVELIIGSTYKELDYDIRLRKSFAEDNREEDEYQLDLLYKEFRFKTTSIFYGDAYDEEKDLDFTVEYDGISNIELGYSYFIEESKSNGRVTDYDASISFNKAYDDLLVTADFVMNKARDKDYRLNFYYRGHYMYDVKLNNTWSGEDDSYEALFSIMRKQGLEGLDYGLDISYSNKEEGRIGLKFSLDLDNWLRFDIARENHKTNSSLSIERVVDLKNIKKTSKTMDVSRVKAITYLDSNNNDIYEEGEKLLPYSKINIANEEGITNKDGVAWLYGINNDIIYDIKAEIRKPSFSTGEKKLKLQGIRSGTIEAYIPVKAKVNFNGQVGFKYNLGLSEENKKKLYEQMAVRIKTSSGEYLETLLIEEDGSFVLSDIYPGKYIADFNYWGSEYEISKEPMEVEIKYLDGEDEIFNFDFNLIKNGD